MIIKLLSSVAGYYFPSHDPLQDVDLAYIARITKGFSGADLTEICQRVSPSTDIASGTQTLPFPKKCLNPQR